MNHLSFRSLSLLLTFVSMLSFTIVDKQLPS